MDAKKAQCTLDSDRERIFAMIEGMDGGFHELNVRVKELLREWLLGSTRDIVSKVCPERTPH
jgi:hypothetical protein